MGITYGQTLQSYGSHWFLFSVSCNTLCSCCLCSINISRPTKTSCCNSCFSWVWRLSISSNLAYSKTNLTCKMVIFSRLALVLLTPSTWSGVASFNWVACVKLNTSAYNDMIRRRTCFSSSRNFAFSSFSVKSTVSLPILYEVSAFSRSARSCEHVYTLKCGFIIVEWDLLRFDLPLF